MQENLSDRDDIDAWVRRNAGFCVESFRKLGQTLDFSAGSIPLMERMVDPVLSVIARQTDDLERRETMMLVLADAWGAYLGETMRRCHGGDWAWHADGAALEFPGGATAYPVNKVRKRFWSGPQDDLAAFFRASGDVADGAARPAE